MSTASLGALHGVRVLEITDDFGAYAGRLLADLGAEVTWIEIPETRRVLDEPPLIDTPDGPRSAFELFVNAGKRIERLDPTAPESRERLRDLVLGSDVIIESSRPHLSEIWSDAELEAILGDRVRVIVTPFGIDEDRPWSGANDLLVMAEGGLLHLGGYLDTGPIAAAGGQSRFAAAIFAAVAAIAGVIERESSGQGAVFDVSGQECIAQALEDSATAYALTGAVRGPTGDQPREAASGIYPCRDGYVSMVAGRLGTARAWASLVAWLNDAGLPSAGELLEERWGEFEFRRSAEAVEAFSRIFGDFAATRTKEDLYHEAQRRMIALSPVNTIEDLVANDQLRHREFFTPVSVAEHGLELVYPRPPYRLSATPPRSATAPAQVTG